ncbi:MAG: methionine adenosyltransferase [Candidatus Puniceispirillum sp.]|nr:methionine adenosyltransferase [Candidatus Pelagibacter sp.]MBA4282822.1 methionine adenosyltransferase [Candidatus Puniceispirillum sp.]
MSNRNFFFTSESVAKGHPDKLCDQISDMLLDHILKHDSLARTGIEVMATTNRVVVAGEIKSSYVLENKTVEDLIRDLVKELDYRQEGFHCENLQIENYLHAQSEDISLGLDKNCVNDEGAGDQGMMFGFACKETETYMPAALDWSHKILINLEHLRRIDLKEELGPDAKTQVTLEYENGLPVRASKIVLSTQHHHDFTQENLKSKIIPMIQNTLPKGWTDHTEFLINPTGRFVKGGPDADCGLTGRKIIVDTYGGYAPHGGGAFSGKDPTKVDRSAAYYARYLAKNIVASGLTDKCLVQLSYAIGVAQPVSVYLDFYNQGHVPEEIVLNYILKNLDLSPYGMRTHLNLNCPIYQRTACYGHFGRIAEQNYFSWEQLNLVNDFKKVI